MDADGVGHTVALPDPSAAMTPGTISDLEALSIEERVRVLDALDRYYWHEYVTGEREEYATSGLGPEGAPLPEGFVVGTVRTAEDAMAIVRSTEPAWRIDVLEALQDYLESTEAAKDLEALPASLRRSARVELNGEIRWPVADAADAVRALAEAGRVVVGLDIRNYDDSGRFIEVPWSDYDDSDPEAARAAALDALQRGDLPGDWVLVTWRRVS